MSGLIVFPILLIFVFCAYIIYRITFYFTQKKRLSRIVFAFVLFLPFLDLIPQKIIKTYYQLFLMEPTVYSYPEFDKDGKIHSLSMEVRSLFGEYKFENDEIYKSYSYYISNFFEQKNISSYSKNYGKKLRLILKDKTYAYVQELKAKYAVKKLPKENGFLGVYKIRRIQIVDTANNKVLGESMNINFESDYGYFRDKVLLLGFRSPVTMVDGIYSGYGRLKKLLLTKGVKKVNK